MSAPDTNIDTQTSNHAGPLAGIGIVLGIVGLGFLGYVSYAFLAGEEPQGAEVQVIGTTGEKVDG